VYIPQRLKEEAFWELENDLQLEVFRECEKITSSKEEARQLYINVRAMHFILLEKKQKIQEGQELVRTEEIWDEMKKEIKSKL